MKQQILLWLIILSFLFIVSCGKKLGKVTFDTQGGERIASQSVSVLETPPTAKREGYQFLGWYLNEDLTRFPTFPMTVDSDVTLYAKWQKIIYSVHFFTDDGTVINPMQTEKMINPPVPEKEGYTFEGWYREKSCVTPVLFPLEVTSDITLYAKWDKVTYTTSFNTNGGTYVESQKTEKIENMPISYREGYIFAGWYRDATFLNRVSFPFVASEDVTLYAKWEKILYTVSFQTNGGDPIADQVTDYVSSAPSTIRSWHSFDGWYTDPYLTAPASFPLKVDKDMTLYAKWIRTSQSRYYEKAYIKNLDSSLSKAHTIRIPLDDFNLMQLAMEGYTMNITVSFDIRYKKDYDVIGDVGYMGAPKYDVTLYDQYGNRDSVKGRLATLNASMQIFHIYIKPTDLLKNEIQCKISTENIQNIIYIENLSVYCYAEK